MKNGRSLTKSSFLYPPALFRSPFFGYFCPSVLPRSLCPSHHALQLTAHITNCRHLSVSLQFCSTAPSQFATLCYISPRSASWPLSQALWNFNPFLIYCSVRNLILIVFGAGIRKPAVVSRVILDQLACSRRFFMQPV